MKKVITFVFGLVPLFVFAQDRRNDPEQYKDMFKIGSAYVDVHFMGQIWARYTELNPGSTVKSVEKDGIFDVGLRRWRISSTAIINPRAKVFMQFGQNNFNFKSTKFAGAFFHDAQFEYDISKAAFMGTIQMRRGHLNKKELAWLDRKMKGYTIVTLGAGLFGWSGPSRYSSPSVGNLLAIDAPLYQQATNGVTDQFLRKVGVYAKGEIKKLEYRIALTTPMTVTGVETTPNQDYSVYNPTATSLQPQAYVKYQFFEKESINSAYSKSTYLGKKKILALGSGFVQQNEAFWKEEANGDTTTNDMLQIGVDVFYESKMDSSRYGVTAYVAYHRYQFGKNYIRNIGAMNPATGTNDGTILNGSGNAFPTLGTGNSIYYQLALNIKRDIYGIHRESKGTIKRDWSKKRVKHQFYTTGQVGDFDGLNATMYVFNVGVNYFPKGNQKMKLTLDYQNRPVYQGDVFTNSVITRKGQYTLQYQLSF